MHGPRVDAFGPVLSLLKQGPEALADRIAPTVVVTQDFYGLALPDASGKEWPGHVRHLRCTPSQLLAGNFIITSNATLDALGYRYTVQPLQPDGTQPVMLAVPGTDASRLQYVFERDRGGRWILAAVNEWSEHDPLQHIPPPECPQLPADAA